MRSTNSALRIDNTCATPGCRAPRDRWLTLQLLIALPLLAAAMKLLGFRRSYSTLRWASAGRVQRAARRPGAGSTARGAESSVRSTDGQRGPHHIAAVVVHVNRHVLPYQSKCLLESTALWYLLRRRGYSAELLLGARTLLGPFEAHAWVELDGEALNDTANVRDIYEPFNLARASQQVATAKPESP